MRIIDFLSESLSQSFVLHPELNPNDYIMTNSLKDHEKWKARTYVNNNYHDDVPEDELRPIGYIMISLTNNTIIPISRDDEHHRGMDLLYDLCSGEYGDYYGKKGKKKQPILKINPSDYIPIWSYGDNYIYEQSEVSKMLIVIKKFLAYGGKNGLLQGASRMNGKMCSLRDFIESNGNMEITPGKLSPLGQRLYDDFAELSKLIANANDTDDRIKLHPVFSKAIELFRNIPTMLVYKLGLELSMQKDVPIQIRQLQKNNDLQGLRELFFGYGGIKNTMHTSMKKEDNWYKDDLKAIWGDVDMAIDMLGKL